MFVRVGEYVCACVIMGVLNMIYNVFVVFQYKQYTTTTLCDDKEGNKSTPFVRITHHAAIGQTNEKSLLIERHLFQQACLLNLTCINKTYVTRIRKTN